ncbi:DUF927 domain-containing protein [Salmonella enterica]|uniref:DUF927 domain-containing protein n=1 Tax=Salmonella enterica TaxID=28901 RepID=UPI000B489F04|nr:DUF927 domain-containing protein [Salmonella enterica]EBR3871220.1 DUF927 domain-containing protein [Salmonella enterica subsp. enterica]ASA50338.1 DNA primase [Salmonella enterica subsp. enterica serovar Minnesota]EAW8860708.1 DUF927 domain-containing protein [Salmonella enterica]EBP1378392.1 DUF927 domain-containing protein [Salmonella enterica]EDS6394630.1 DUF927 domain-containing protein [Salmonella enterica subsp. enterica serovar Minnesota]
MKNAPNLKCLPKDKFTEAIIFAGSDAYAHAQGWLESMGKQIAGDATPPVWLGPKQLAELHNLRIIDKGRRCARVYQAGEIEPIVINAIAEKLAQAGVQEAKLYRGIPDQQPEDWRDYLMRLREQAERGESLVAECRRATGKRAPVDELAPCVESRAGGLYWVTPKIDRQSGEVIRPGQWLCDPLEVLGEGKDSESDAMFFALRWNCRGKEVTHYIRAGLIGDPQGWALLKDSGLKVVTQNTLRAKLSDWIQIEAGNGVQYTATPRSGWFGDVYIMPNGDVIGEADTPVMFTGGSAARTAYSVSGTAQSWRENVAKLAYKNPFQMLAAGTAFAAPLIGIVGADGFGIHLYADSTAGKTTAEDFGSSIYGEPKQQRLSWYGTALGIANEAEAHNHGLLALDEIEQASSARCVFTSAYTLFNGKGKLQGDPNGGNRDLKYFETVVISTGEKSVETFLAGANIKVKAGQLVRLLNIPVTRPTELHGYENGEKHAKALKAAWLEHHGAAGREWIKWLSAHRVEVKEAYLRASQRWDSIIPSDYGEQVHRVKDRFAILETALILSEQITGWDAQACRDVLQHVFNVWVAEFGTGNKEHEQIIEQATAFLMANGISRFVPVDFDELSQLNVHNLAGYKDKGVPESGEPVTFYVLPAPFKSEVAKDFDVNKAARTLYEAGILKPPRSGKGWQVKTPRIKHINNRQLRAYALLLVDEENAE